MAGHLIHAITPGDHYSPRTGSAIPTVVDGLARAALAASGPEQAVLIARGTYSDRYPSARAIEYIQAPHLSAAERYADLLGGRLLQRRHRVRRMLSPLLRSQENWQPSIILAHNLVELVPLVDTRRHRTMLYAHNDLLRTYTRREVDRALAPCEIIVCVSRYLTERIQDRLPTGMRSRVVTVPNGVDCDRFFPGFGARNTDQLRVAFVGRMVPEKGADVLLEAVRRLDRPDITVTLVGSAGFDRNAPLTPYERSLRVTAAQCPSKVTFLPFTPRYEVAALLREHDVLAVPSRWPEPWGLTVSEGLASGLVVVASAVGGIPEAVAEHDLLVSPDDPPGLATALARFADDRSALELGAARSRVHALAHDWRASWRILAQLIG
jgi:glycosyltransferase involved in cell wall biosynthesis